MNYTTIEQSKKLLELGVNPESADMCFSSTSYNSHGPYCRIAKTHKANLEFNDLPCWSLSALLEMMPAVIDGEFKLRCIKDNIVPGYYFSYHNHTNNRNKTCFASKTPIYAAFNMVVWLIENGYIKTK